MPRSGTGDAISLLTLRSGDEAFPPGSWTHQRSTIAFLYAMKSTSGGTGQASNGGTQATGCASPSVHRSLVGNRCFAPVRGQVVSRGCRPVTDSTVKKLWTSGTGPVRRTSAIAGGAGTFKGQR